MQCRILYNFGKLPARLQYMNIYYLKQRIEQCKIFKLHFNVVAMIVFRRVCALDVLVAPR